NGRRSESLSALTRPTPSAASSRCPRATLDVDVRGGADVGVAEQLLRRVDVAGGEVEPGAGRVAGAVHLLAVRGALVDDAGAREAAIQPAMRAGPESGLRRSSQITVPFGPRFCG